MQEQSTGAQGGQVEASITWLKNEKSITLEREEEQKIEQLKIGETISLAGINKIGERVSIEVKRVNPSGYRFNFPDV